MEQNYDVNQRPTQGVHFFAPHHIVQEDRVKQEFSIKDLERMVEISNKLKTKCSILISNFSVDLVKDYFKKKDGWHIRETEKTTFISGKAKGRTKVKEAIIYNKL